MFELLANNELVKLAPIVIFLLIVSVLIVILLEPTKDKISVLLVASIKLELELIVAKEFVVAPLEI